MQQGDTELNDGFLKQFKVNAQTLELADSARYGELLGSINEGSNLGCNENPENLTSAFDLIVKTVGKSQVQALVVDDIIISSDKVLANLVLEYNFYNNRNKQDNNNDKLQETGH
eukprot:7039743-Ditylum_brightwellii.AAC.1